MHNPILTKGGLRLIKPSSINGDVGLPVTSFLERGVILVLLHQRGKLWELLWLSMSFNHQRGGSCQPLSAGTVFAAVTPRR